MAKCVAKQEGDYLGLVLMGRCFVRPFLAGHDQKR